MKVLIELSLAEFKEDNVEDRWNTFRVNDAAFLKAILIDLLPADAILEPPKKASWYHSGTAWEAATAIAILTRKGYSIFSKKAADRLLFPRLFIGNLVGEASIADGGPALDEHWEMLWCQESFSKVPAKCQRIPANYFGGIRHKRGKEWDSTAYLYGWRISKEWYSTGEPQRSLLAEEERVIPAMQGVRGDFDYTVDYTHFVANMEKEQVAEFLFATTRSDEFPWKTLPVKQVFSNGGKGTELRHWLVSADHPPSKGFYRVGSATLHIRPVAQKEERPLSASGGKG